jgi:hypothetical protein
MASRCKNSKENLVNSEKIAYFALCFMAHP